MSSDPTLLGALARLQAALLLLAAGGEVAVMGGNPVYLLAPLAVAALLVRCAAAVTRPRPERARRTRRMLRAVVVVETVALLTVPGSVLVSLTRWVVWTPTVTGLATTVVLPAAVLVLARRARREVPV
ncbi:MAG TPA: hypothetical protein VE781_09475 [Kineosporiaceae bacterium]|jgi:hypothetical protein|nr:hypothetical protein [Kineosporiaceae bacterium]